MTKDTSPGDVPAPTFENQIEIDQPLTPPPSTSKGTQDKELPKLFTFDVQKSRENCLHLTFKKVVKIVYI